MEQVVIDSSVLAKVFFEEKYTENALKLKDAYINESLDVTAPSLIFYELMNIMLSKKAQPSEMEAITESAYDYGFEIKEADELLAAITIDTATTYGLTAYDAAYVALARINSSILYTADQKLLDKVNDKKIARHIKEF